MKIQITGPWIVAVMWVHITASAGNVYYVSPSGDDGHPGSLENPWKTLGKAATTLEAGDTVYVRAGTYIERVKPQRSGNPTDGYITYSRFENETVTLRDTGLPSGDNDEVMIWISGLRYIKIIGFHVDGHKGNGIRVDGPGDHIEVRDCIVSNQIYSTNVPIGASHALLISGWLEYAGPLEHVIVDNCEIYNNSTGTPSGYNEAFTILGDVSDFQITNNYIHDNHYIGNDYIGQPEYEGTAFGIPTKGIIKGNVLENNGTNAPWCSGIYCDGAGFGNPDEILCEGNISIKNSFAGIELGDEHDNTVSGGWTVRRNVCYDNDYYGLTLASFGTPIKNTKIHNNVFYKNKMNQLSIGSAYVSHAALLNNIMVKSGDYAFIYWSGGADATITSDHNCWWPAGGEFQWGGSSYIGLSAFQSATGQDQHSIEQDPLFVDPIDHDFHLRANSPCIDKGTDVGLPYVGKAPDIGAYEYAGVVECQTGDQRSCYEGPSGTAGVGICRSGTQRCRDGIWSDCTDQVLPQTEVCEGSLDENCNGTVDDGCPCATGQERTCYQGPDATQGIGICRAGTQMCQDGTWPDTCTGQVLPKMEVCRDEVDNDCDGRIDEDCSNSQTKLKGGCTSAGTQNNRVYLIILLVSYLVALRSTARR